jgi:hypothetical protein
MRKLLPFLVCLIPLACGGGGSAEGDAASNGVLEFDDEFAVLERGKSSSFGSTSTIVMNEPSEWSSHYNLHIGDTLSTVTAPTVDFDAEDLIAIHLGPRPTFAYSVEVDSVSFDTTDGTIQIRYYESIDTTSEWPSTVSYPYIFIRTHADGYEYRFIQLDSREI